MYSHLDALLCVSVTSFHFEKTGVSKASPKHGKESPTFRASSGTYRSAPNFSVTSHTSCFAQEINAWCGTTADDFAPADQATLSG